MKKKDLIAALKNFSDEDEVIISGGIGRGYSDLLVISAEPSDGNDSHWPNGVDFMHTALLIPQVIKG